MRGLEVGVIAGERRRRRRRGDRRREWPPVPVSRCITDYLLHRTTSTVANPRAQPWHGT